MRGSGSDTAKNKTTFVAGTGDAAGGTASQTHITGAIEGADGPAGNAHFYMLEYPPTEAELALALELEDLNFCAMVPRPPGSISGIL